MFFNLSHAEIFKTNLSEDEALFFSLPSAIRIFITSSHATTLSRTKDFQARTAVDGRNNGIRD